ncbi:MAG: FAD-dependent oxidoreductase [Paracoccaceae bacterium]
MTRWTGEAEPGRPYWWDVSSTASDLSDVPPGRCDILIIGAGYTGLSAAIAAHSGGANVVVVDAGVPGHGASTRNGGMFGAHPRLSWKALAKYFGSATADAIFGEGKPALEFVKT